MGEGFSAKDFRTWAGTLLCASALAKVGCEEGESKTARKKKVVAAVKETADQLGNTAAVCRSAYIDPSVLQGFAQGQVFARMPSGDEAKAARTESAREARGTGLRRTERALLSWLARNAEAPAKGHKRSPPRPSVRRASRRAQRAGRRGVARPGGV
jgi:DNA topoisomerase-1